MITSADQWDSERWSNFTPDEFKCSHCGELKISPVILDFVQAYRQIKGSGVTIIRYRLQGQKAHIQQGLQLIFLLIHKHNMD